MAWTNSRRTKRRTSQFTVIHFCSRIWKSVHNKASGFCECLYNCFFSAENYDLVETNANTEVQRNGEANSHDGHEVMQTCMIE